MLLLNFLSTAQAAPPPQLTISKTASQSGPLNPIQTGQVVEYTITVTNNTAITATNLPITDPIAVGLALSKLDTLHEMDSLWWLVPSAAVTQQRDLLVADLQANAAQQEAILEAHSLQLATDMAMLASQNATIVGTVSSETYEQQINAIYLQTVALGHADFSATQIAMLDNVAPLCPLEFGKAVYTARAMLFLVRGVELYDDEDACNMPQLRRTETAVDELSPAQNELFRLYPNPAQSQISIT